MRTFFIVFSGGKLEETFSNGCTRWMTKGDDVHVTILTDVGYEYSADHISGLHKKQLMTVAKRLRDGSERHRSYYKFQLADAKAEALRTFLDKSIEKGQDYDKRMVYGACVFGMVLPVSRAAEWFSNPGAVTCSRVVYDALRHPTVGVLDPMMYQERLGVFPVDIKEIILQDPLEFMEVNTEQVNQIFEEVTEKGKIRVGAAAVNEASVFSTETFFGAEQRSRAMVMME